MHDAAPRPIDGPYVLYAGKLATNKGVQYLLPALDRRRHRPGRSSSSATGRCARPLEAEAQRARRRRATMLGWLRSRRRSGRGCGTRALLAFPSYGPESLSRVLIEASALGAPIAAMNTGGTRDILQHGVTGLLSDDAAASRATWRALAADERLRARARRRGARVDAHAHFAAPSVVERVEQVYRRCCCRGPPDDARVPSASRSSPAR